MIQAVHHELELVIRDVSQIGIFREILADQAVDVFIEPALPSVIGIRKIDLGLEFSGDSFMSGELPAIVGGDGMYHCEGKPLTIMVLQVFFCWTEADP